MIVRLEIQAASLFERLERLGPRVRERLIEALAPIAAEMGADARARASSHIRFMGGEPGAYVEGIQSGVSTKNEHRVTGYVRSENPKVPFHGRMVPLAALLEYGAKIGPHEILPVLGKALKFKGSAGEAFARAVQSPGAAVPAYPAIHPAFDARRTEIAAALEEAVHGL